MFENVRAVKKCAWLGILVMAAGLCSTASVAGAVPCDFLLSPLEPIQLTPTQTSQLDPRGHDTFYYLTFDQRARKVTYLKGFKNSFLGYHLPIGYVENLSAYEEDAVVNEGDRGSSDLEFHIERTVTKELGNSNFGYTYSAMINSIFELGRGQTFEEARDELARKIQQLDGFVSNKDFSFKKEDEQLLINLSNWDGRLNIGVIHTGRLESLDDVLSKVVPQIVSLHNKLNPKRTISKNVMRASQKVAAQVNRITPEPSPGTGYKGTINKPPQVTKKY